MRDARVPWWMGWWGGALALGLCVFLPSCEARQASAGALELRHVRTLKNDFTITTLAWHPDGRHLAVGQVLHKRIAIWDTREGKQVRMLTNESGGVSSLAYCPDGKYLAVGREFTRLTPDKAHVHLYDADSGALLHRFIPPSAPVKGDSNDASKLAFSPDSRYLAAVGYGSDTNIVLYATESNTVFDRTTDESKARSEGRRVGGVEALAFSPGGELLAVGRNLGELEIWSMKPWGLLRRLEGQSAGVRALAFSPDGKYLATGTHVGERHDRSSGRWRQVFGKFNDDITLWSVPAFEKTAEFPSRHYANGGTITIIHVQFTPDGRFLLVGARSKSLEFIDVTSGRTAFFQNGYRGIVHPMLSPDGKHLAIAVDDKIEIHKLIIH